MIALTDARKIDQKGIRNSGGGRKKKIDTMYGIDEAFHEILKNHTAGDPMNGKVKWTTLTGATIAKRLKEKGFPVSKNIAQDLLKKHGYVKRKAQKKRALVNTKKEIDNLRK